MLAHINSVFHKAVTTFLCLASQYSCIKKLELGIASICIDVKWSPSGTSAGRILSSVFHKATTNFVLCVATQFSCNKKLESGIESICIDVK